MTVTYHVQLCNFRASCNSQICRPQYPYFSQTKFNFFRADVKSKIFFQCIRNSNSLSHFLVQNSFFQCKTRWLTTDQGCWADSKLAQELKFRKHPSEEISVYIPPPDSSTPVCCNSSYVVTHTTIIMGPHLFQWAPPSVYFFFINTASSS